MLWKEALPKMSVNIPSGALYIDLAVEQDTGASTPLLINNYPADGQTQIPVSDRIGDAEVSHPIYLTIVDPTSSGMSAGDTTVSVNINAAGAVQVFDGAAFHADWNTDSSYSAVDSSGGATPDEHRLILVRESAFTSLDSIVVTVHGETNGASNLDTSFSFTIEDLTKPELVSVASRGLTAIRLTFNEVMEQDTDNYGDSLRVRNITAGLEVNI
jgi:hypothetical protein